MKKTLIALAIVAAVPAAFAVSGERGPWGPGRGPNLDRLEQVLELDEDQRTELEAVFQEHRAQREAMRAQMHTQMRDRMAEVLTPDQLAKMDELRQMRRERRAFRRGRHCGYWQSELDQ